MRLKSLKVIIVLLLVVLTSDLLHAEDFPTLWLETGKTSKYSGYLWSEEKTLEAIKQSMERDLFKIELEKTYKRIEQLESKSEWEKWMWIGAGVVITVLAGWSLGQVKKDVSIMRF